MSSARRVSRESRTRDDAGVEPLSENAMRLLADAVAHGDGPQRLHRAWQAHELTESDLPELIHYIWTRNDNAAWLVDSTEWVKMFRSAGLILRKTNQAIPSFPLTIYRGTTEERKRAMAWTREIDTAREFQRRYKQKGEDPHVYQTIVRRDAVLALFNTRPEHEIVVEPVMLQDIEQVG